MGETRPRSLRWLSAHRSLIATATSGTVIAALIATLAIVSSGFTAQRFDLGDGSVWVANTAAGVIGRANPQVLALDTVVATTAADIQVVQQGPTVLLLDRTDSTVQIVDAATSAIVSRVALPAEDPNLLLAGRNVVITSDATGEVWIIPITRLAGFDPQSPPTLTLGANIVVSVDPSGMLFVYSPVTRTVSRIDAARSDTVVESTPVAEWRTVAQQAAEPQTPPGQTGGSPAANRAAPVHGPSNITSVGGQWAILDPSNRVLITANSVVQLSDQLPSNSTPVLQQAASSGDGVLIAYSGGMIGVGIADHRISSVVTGGGGLASAPVVVGGCTFVAWAAAALWRKCGISAARQLATPSMPTSGAHLVFAVNGEHVVLNDSAGGATWAAQRSGELIDNWSDLVTPATDPNRVDTSNADKPPAPDLAPQPPVATDDNFGARPGRATSLAVLLNDYDPNGDAIAVSSVTPIDAAIGTVVSIDNGQRLQLTLSDAARGSVNFTYSITDGRGGTATATVHVTVRLATENSPPVQVRQSHTSVQAGGRVTVDVLGDWVDPDGDAIYLESATTAGPDSVVSTPEGSVVFIDGATTPGTRKVSLTVSDGTATSSGSLSVTVGAFDQVPLVITPFVVFAYSGKEVTIHPLEHVSGGNGSIHLTSVPAKSGVTVTANLERGSFTFSSLEVGTHFIEFVVNDSSHTASGMVRIDVAPAPEANVRPVTIPKTVFVTSLGARDIDVAETDFDPAGGVLLVTSIDNLSATSGVSALILAERSVRVTLTAPLELGPVTFDYRVTNGLAESQGTITVVEIPRPAVAQPPIARDDSVTARVGDAIDIPVLDNDVQPTGGTVRLDPELISSRSPDSGLLFVSGDVLRYLAPDHPGDFTAVYQISNSSGQVAQASVSIAVREPLISTNLPPVPATVTARVFAGETVRIAIPLLGIDPNGDSVSLLGQATNPERGSVTAVGIDYFDYLAGDYSAGTDSFGYSVVDALGARAVGTVRVGISAKPGEARNPVAVPDEVTVRPGGTVSVQVLENDSNPDGGPLTIVGVEPTSRSVTATITGAVITVSPPARVGRYSLIYTIENSFGGRSSAFLTVNVRADAPRSYPIVSDSVLTLSDVLGRTSLDVDVLKKVFFADGKTNTLDVSVVPGYSSDAHVLANKSIRVPVTGTSQIIPFAIAHPDDPAVVSYGLIRVPGLTDSLPQVNPAAPALTVVSGSALTIDLGGYVLSVGGRKIILAGQGQVKATRSDGSNPVVNDHTLRFVSANRYFGPASIAFDVTDAASGSPANGRVVTVVLPITVTPGQNQPPLFVGGVIDFEPGTSRVIDLPKLTDYPYPKDADQLAYTVLSPLPVGFSFSLTGQKLTLTANESAAKNTSTSLTVAVRDSRGAGQSGSIRLGVVASSRPLAQAADDSASVQRGKTVPVDVLANDQATNPFPGRLLTVIAIRGLDGSSLPTGITITPSSDHSHLDVSAASSAAASVVTLQYEIADATGDPDRYVWGSVIVSVQDVPEPVSDISVTAFGDRSLTVRFSPGSSNNSPITGYTVSQISPAGTALVSSQCATAVCTIATRGNGPENGVVLRVSATNAIGVSLASDAAGIVWSDVLPAAPGGLSAQPLDGGLRVTWNPVVTPAGGSPVIDYRVTVASVSVQLASSDCSQSLCTIDIPGLTNGQVAAVSVIARNSALPALANWNPSHTNGTPAGKPVLTGSTPVAAGSTTTVHLSWPGVFAENGSAITGFLAVAYTAGAPTCAVQRPAGSIVQDAGTSTSAVFSALTNDSEYRLVVLATNGVGCEVSVPVVARTSPGVVSNIEAADASPGKAEHDFSLSGASIGTSRLGADYVFYYRLSGGTVSAVSYGPISLGGLLTAEGTQYGQSISVEVRACRTYSDSAVICQSSWSSPFAIGVAVDPRVDPVRFTASDAAQPAGTFTWSRWPTAPSGNYALIQFSCDPAGLFTIADTTRGGSCAVTASSAAAPTLTVRVTANGGKNYDITYDQAGNVQ